MNEKDLEEKAEQFEAALEGLMSAMEELRKDRDRLKKLAERPRGRWKITDAWPHNVYCSECHKRFAQTHWSIWEDGSLPRNFCPYCGAMMENAEVRE